MLCYKPITYPCFTMLVTESKLLTKFESVRKRSEMICQPLAPEDHVVQPIEAVSPPKWHLAHTTWFYEVFLLQKYVRDYQLYHPDYPYLFNSYYISMGDRMIRGNRGNMTRPTTREIWQYRRHVDEAMSRWLESELTEEQEMLVTLGLNHEQQHQELMLYDIKYILGTNPVFPAYASNVAPVQERSRPMRWINLEEGLYEVGFQGDGFCFDNELGRHKVYLHEAAIADRLTTNGEYLEFIEDGGYHNHIHWHSEGWEWVNKEQVEAPLYWHKIDGEWHTYTLKGGLLPVDKAAPVSHVSFYEAFAFAKWAGKRLPTEFEWESVCGLSGDSSNGNFMETERYAAKPAAQGEYQFYGDLWEWTGSAYLPYPFYKPPAGAVGEYNGKFMVSQMVLRGGSCATPSDHIRPTYRNFFHPDLRWMFSGIRLAKHL